MGYKRCAEALRRVGVAAGWRYIAHVTVLA